MGYLPLRIKQSRAEAFAENGDGVLTFDELYKYLADNQEYGVPYLAKELEGEQVRQNPVIQVSVRAKDAFVKY